MSEDALGDDARLGRLGLTGSGLRTVVGIVEITCPFNSRLEVVHEVGEYTRGFSNLVYNLQPRCTPRLRVRFHNRRLSLKPEAVGRARCAVAGD